MLREEIYQGVTFLLVVLFFDLMERTRPAFAVSRRRQLPLNALSLVIVIVAGELWRRVIMGGYEALRLGTVLSGNPLHALPGAAKIFLAIVLADLSLYGVHRAMHRRLLWPTHAFHHTIGEIWWLAGSRTSATHLFLFAVPQIFIGYYLLGMTAAHAAVAFSFGVAVNLWIHTNLWVNLGPLEKLIITPNFHRIHHGARGLTNRNLGFVFTVWDRLFGTYASTDATGKDFPLLPVPTRHRLLRMIIGF